MNRCIVISLIALVLCGCSPRYQLIAGAVGKEWQCPIKSVEVISLGASRYAVMGCRQAEIVYCKIGQEGCHFAGKPNQPLKTREYLQAAPNTSVQ